MSQSVMKRFLFSIFLTLFIFSGAWAQRRNGLIGHRSENEGSLILSIGPNYCFADTYNSHGFWGPIANQSVLNNRDITIGFRQSFTDNTIYILLGQTVTTDFGYKASLSYDNFTGDDTNQPNARDFSFNSTVFQLACQSEFSIHLGKSFRSGLPHTVYGLLGAGVLNSKANLDTGITGRGNYKYAPNGIDITPIISYGFGYHYNFNQFYYIGAEFKWEYTFSDLS